METRSCLSNLILVGLPEGAEGRDPEVPDAEAHIEQARRTGSVRDSKAPPRTLIMKFLNHKDKQAVMAAARAEKDIRYKDQEVDVNSDLATGKHQLRKNVDPIRQELRSLGIRHGMILPTRLLVTHKDQTYTFQMPAEA